MKKLLIFIALSLFAYAQKPYMLIVFQPGCPACEELRHMIDSDKDLKNTIHQYTDLQLLTKTEAESVGFTVGTTPSIYFFAKERRQLLSEPMEGVPHSSLEFSAYIKEIHKKYNDYLNSQTSQKQNTL